MAVNHGLKIDCSNGSCDFREVKLWLLPYFLEKLDSSTSGQYIEQLARHPVTCCRTTLCGLCDFPCFTPEATLKSALEVGIQSTFQTPKLRLLPPSLSCVGWPAYTSIHMDCYFSPSKPCPLPIFMEIGGGKKGGSEGLPVNSPLWFKSQSWRYACVCAQNIFRRTHRKSSNRRWWSRRGWETPLIYWVTICQITF